MGQYDKLDPVLTGAWDTHVHAGPDVVERKADVLDLVEVGDSLEMGGMVLKNHYFPTGMLATIANNWLDSTVSLVGTLVLNRSVGGLNPDAIQAAGRLGIKRVELPTMTAKYNMVEQHEPKTIELIEGDELSTRCIEALDTALAQDMIVGTGHISIDETIRVVDYVTQQGGKVLITHPELHLARDGIGMTIEQQISLAREGVFFERCLVAAFPDLKEHLRSEATEKARDLFERGDIWDYFVRGIEATGPANNVLSTDLGQPTNQLPPVGLIRFHEKLLDAGISRRDIVTMGRDNAESMFGRT